MFGPSMDNNNNNNWLSHEMPIYGFVMIFPMKTVIKFPSHVRWPGTHCIHCRPHLLPRSLVNEARSKAESCSFTSFHLVRHSSTWTIHGRDGCVTSTHRRFKSLVLTSKKTRVWVMFVPILRRFKGTWKENDGFTLLGSVLLICRTKFWDRSSANQREICIKKNTRMVSEQRHQRRKLPHNKWLFFGLHLVCHLTKRWQPVPPRLACQNLLQETGTVNLWNGWGLQFNWVKWWFNGD